MSEKIMGKKSLIGQKALEETFGKTFGKQLGHLKKLLQTLDPSQEKHSLSPQAKKIFETNLQLAQDSFRHGLENTITNAALYLNLEPTLNLKNQAKQTPEDHTLQEIIPALKLHQELKNDTSIAKNAELVNEPNKNAYRATILRMLEIARQPEELRVNTAKSEVEKLVEDVYMPFALQHKLESLREELGDAYLKEFHPTEHKRISKEIKDKHLYFEQAQTNLFLAMARLSRTFKKETGRNVEVETRKRLKSAYDVYIKRKKGRSTEFDIAGVRAIVHELPGEKEEATNLALRNFFNKALELFPHRPDRIKDYVSQPKTTGYQAIHVPLIVNIEGKGIPVEAQFRSRKMHEEAETGFAWHSGHKGLKGQNVKALTIELRMKHSTGQISSKEFQSHIGPQNVAVWARTEQQKSEQLFIARSGTTPLDLFFDYGFHEENRYPKDARIIQGDKVKKQLHEPLQNGDKILFTTTKHPTLNLLAKHEAKANPQTKASIQNFMNHATVSETHLRRRKR